MRPRPKILLVDDSALVRAVVTRTLGPKADVVTIDDPRALSAAMERDRPDLLLVDATFPGIDHEELARLVRPHGAERPVVLFSDRAPDVLEGLAEKMGARGSVPKEAASGALWHRLEPFLGA